MNKPTGQLKNRARPDWLGCLPVTSKPAPPWPSEFHWKTPTWPTHALLRHSASQHSALPDNEHGQDTRLASRNIAGPTAGQMNAVQCRSEAVSSSDKFWNLHIVTWLVPLQPVFPREAIFKSPGEKSSVLINYSDHFLCWEALFFFGQLNNR